MEDEEYPTFKKLLGYATSDFTENVFNYCNYCKTNFYWYYGKHQLFVVWSTFQFGKNLCKKHLNIHWIMEIL